MKMDEGETITIKVGGADNEPKNGTTNNEVIDLVDLTDDADTPDDGGVTAGAAAAAAASALTQTSDDSSSTKMILDLVPIAKEMWKFDNWPANPVLTTTYAQLPKPIHHAITKTIVYRFQKRQTLADDAVGESETPKAKFYLQLLKNHSPKLAQKPFDLVALKCTYCSRQPNHVPGCCSFIRISDTDDMPRLLADALHQRLLHLRNNCKTSHQEHGTQVLNIFNSRYNRGDPYLNTFVRTWLQELQRIMKDPEPGTAPPLAEAAAGNSALDERTITYNTAIDPTSAYLQAHGLATVQQQQQQHLVAANPVHYSLQYNTAYPHTQLPPHSQQHLLLQQNQLRIGQQQHEQHLLYQGLSQKQKQLHQQGMQEIQRLENQKYQLELQKQQQKLPQPHEVQQQLQQLQQQRQQQKQQQQQQKQKQQQEQKQKQKQQQQQKPKPKPKPRLPHYFPRNRKATFEELRNLYEDTWEETSYSVFNPPYDSDDDADESDHYFGSLHDNNNGNIDKENTETTMSSYKMSLPPLPSPQKNLDFCLPIQSHELAKCQGGVPFLKDEEILPIPKKGRGRKPSPIDTSLSDYVTSYDVVMACEGCPEGLGKSLHDLIGNRHFLRLVSIQRNAYVVSTSDEERRTIAQTVIQKIRGRGGSFLKANTTKKRTSRTWKASEKEAEEYTVFRLEHGFPDILNNPKIGKGMFRCSTPGTGSKVAAKESDLVVATSGTDTHGAVATTDAVKSPTSAQEFPLSPSKVFDVEHAPKIGLMDGFLAWNNNKTNNPSIKFSRLKTVSSHTIEGASTTSAPVRINHELSIADKQKKPENVNASHGEMMTIATPPKKDAMQSRENVVVIDEEENEDSVVNQQNSEPNDPLEKKQLFKESIESNMNSEAIVNLIDEVVEEVADEVVGEVFGEEENTDSKINQQSSEPKDPLEKNQELKESSNKRNFPEPTSSQVSESQSEKRFRSEEELVF